MSHYQLFSLTPFVKKDVFYTFLCCSNTSHEGEKSFNDNGILESQLQLSSNLAFQTSFHQTVGGQWFFFFFIFANVILSHTLNVSI